MRWILYVLLFLNFAAFFWFWRDADPVAPSTTPEVPADVPGLVLLSERNGGNAAGQAVVQSPSAAEAVGEPEITDEPGQSPVQRAQYCASLTGFTDAAQAQQFVVAYDSGFRLALATEEAAGSPVYRVYLPPYADRAAASAALSALRERLNAANLNIDSFLIGSGELENGISLGLFSEQQNALNVEKEMTALNYRVTVSEESRSSQQPVVFLEEQPEGASLLELWPQISARYPQLQRTEKLCETIAHEF